MIYSHAKVSFSFLQMNPNTTFSQTYIDIGALQFAFDAYQAIVGNIGVEGTLPGLKRSNDQLFFISFAQVSLISLFCIDFFLQICNYFLLRFYVTNELLFSIVDV